MEQKKLLKKLSKLELLELLAEQEREIQALKQQVEERDRVIEQRVLRAKQFGNIAQAALAVNEVFETAQRAADQYLESVKKSLEERLPRELALLYRSGSVGKDYSEPPTPNSAEEQAELSVDEILQRMRRREAPEEYAGSRDKLEKVSDGCAGG